MNKLLLKAEEVAEMLGVSESTLHHTLRKMPDFPKPRSLAPKVIRWFADDIVSFARSLPRCEAQPEPPQLAARRFKSGQEVK
jgi:predicted DNA-binding transcriptional regulator AlpA